jgi:transposase-like protein
MFAISYRDLELMLRDRGVMVDHTTIVRWIQPYAAELENRTGQVRRMIWGAFTTSGKHFERRNRTKNTNL